MLAPHAFTQYPTGEVFSVLLLPNGVIKGVYPYLQSVIGLDTFLFWNDFATRSVAIRRLFLLPPINLREFTGIPTLPSVVLIGGGYPVFLANYSADEVSCIRQR